MHDAKVRSMQAWVRCPTCNDAIQIVEDNFKKFFLGQSVNCSACKQPIDWWALSLHEITDNFMFNLAFGFIGAKTTSFQFTMKPNERMSYRLVDYGIPADAKILYVNYTPQGPSSWPVEMHGNVPTQKSSRQEVWLYPVPPPNEAPQDTPVAAWVTWVDHSKLDHALNNLVVAFEAYVSGDFASVLVPANVAVESSLSVALNNFLPAFVGADRAESFLKDAAYSHQLNALLPLIVGLKKQPNLSDDIRGQLNSLRTLRNEVAHLGRTKKPLTKETCAQLLCASVFGFKYMTYLREWLKVTD